MFDSSGSQTEVLSAFGGRKNFVESYFDQTPIIQHSPKSTIYVSGFAAANLKLRLWFDQQRCVVVMREYLLWGRGK